MNLVNGLGALPSVSLCHYTVLSHHCHPSSMWDESCDLYEPSKWLSSLTISVSVSLNSTLLSLLILELTQQG